MLYLLHHGGMSTGMFEQISQAIGPIPALTFCAFASARRTFYIPENYIPGHILERLLGEDAFLGMIANFGGETIIPPSMRLDSIRVTGAVYALTQQGLTATQIAQKTGLGYRNVRRLQQRILTGSPLSSIGKSSESSSVASCDG